MAVPTPPATAAAADHQPGQPTTMSAATRNKQTPAQPPENPAEPAAPPTPDELQRAIDMFRPLAAFHQGIDDADDGDVRLFWDVTVIRGKDTTIAHLTGSSTFHRMFAYNMSALAPGRLQEELHSKLVMPLTSAVQELVEKQTFEAIARDKARKPGLDGK